METDRKTIMAERETDNLRQNISDLKSERRLRIQFNAADDKGDFLKMANGNSERAFKNFCLVTTRHG